MKLASFAFIFIFLISIAGCQNEKTTQNLQPLNFKYAGVIVGDEKFVPITCTQFLSKVSAQITVDEDANKEGMKYTQAKRELELFESFFKKIGKIAEEKSLEDSEKKRRAAVYMAEAFVDYRLVNPDAHLRCSQEIESTVIKCRETKDQQALMNCMKESIKPALDKVSSFRQTQLSEKKS